MPRVVIPGFATGPSLFPSWPCTVLPNRTNSYAETAHHLASLAEEGPLDLFGWSLGSLFGLRWTLEHPDTVRSLFLTGATARFTATPDYPNGIRTERLEQMARLLRTKPRETMTAFFLSFLPQGPSRDSLLHDLLDHLPDPPSLLTGLEELASIDLRDRLHIVSVPVRIVQGTHDHITPPFGAELLARRIPSATLELREGGHALFLEPPQTLGREWIAWTA